MATGNTRGSDERHDRAMLRTAGRWLQARRDGDTETMRSATRVARHLESKANKDHPPTGGPKAKGT